MYLRIVLISISLGLELMYLTIIIFCIPSDTKAYVFYCCTMRYEHTYQIIALSSGIPMKNGLLEKFLFLSCNFGLTLLLILGALITRTFLPGDSKMHCLCFTIYKMTFFFLVIGKVDGELQIGEGLLYFSCVICSITQVVTSLWFD